MKHHCPRCGAKVEPHEIHISTPEGKPAELSGEYKCPVCHLQWMTLVDRPWVSNNKSLFWAGFWEEYT